MIFVFLETRRYWFLYLGDIHVFISIGVSLEYYHIDLSFLNRYYRSLVPSINRADWFDKVRIVDQRWLILFNLSPERVTNDAKEPNVYCFWPWNVEIFLTQDISSDRCSLVLAVSYYKTSCYRRNEKGCFMSLRSDVECFGLVFPVW